MRQQENPVNPKIIQKRIAESPFQTLQQLSFTLVRILEDQPQRAKENPIQHRNEGQDGDNQNIAEDP